MQLDLSQGALQPTSLCRRGKVEPCFVKWREKGCLTFLFLSESSLPSSKSFLSSSEPLPVPILSADPPHDVYYEGERVAIICLAPTMRKIGGFRFFNQTGEQIDLQTPYSLTTAWFHLTATKASSGEYTCMYFLKESGQEIRSNRSLPLSLKVQGRLVVSIWLGYHHRRHSTLPFRASSSLMALSFGCQCTDEVALASHKLLLCSWISLRKQE